MQVATKEASIKRSHVVGKAFSGVSKFDTYLVVLYLREVLDDIQRLIRSEEIFLYQ